MTIDHHWSHMCLIVRIECQSYAESVSDEHDRVAKFNKTRPSALGMSDPIWGPLIHIFVDEKKKCEG